MEFTTSKSARESGEMDSSAHTKIILKFPNPRSLVKEHSQCQPDLFDPSIKCNTSVDTDDRQCVSHFFGRNKTSTASIPLEYFPKLCRQHYQERLYRWGPLSGAYACYQCDCILQVLEKMKDRAFIDNQGLKWPWWCGFELRLIQRVDSANSIQLAPDWLVRMCTQDLDEDGRPPRSGSICGVRYSVEQLVEIVKAIKTWCSSTDSRLPEVEALPMTIGMANMEALDVAKKAYKMAEGRKNLAENEQQDFESRENVSAGQMEKVFSTVRCLSEQAEAAKSDMQLATIDAAATASTRPPKRESQAKHGNIAKSTPPSKLTLRNVKFDKSNTA